MDPKPSSLAMLAPGHASASALHCPSVDDPFFPRVDDHIVEPETRQEMLRGVLMEAQPANPPHAERQVDLAYVIRAHVAPGYICADDLLTRFSHQSNFATDICVRKQGIDPDTGARYLEELAFEIVSEQSMRHITLRAEDIVNRGVRRLIALFIKKGRVAEWSREHNRFEDLPLDSNLEDRTLTRPIPVRALLEATAADETVALGLLEKATPVLLQRQFQARQEGLQEGRQEGR
ncbi:MAG: Uma2 family endonuclease, partial [Myxococcales bacterium]|nr:Uma2 family endonuclease [Myxococcales bacterium]